MFFSVKCQSRNDLPCQELKPVCFAMSKVRAMMIFRAKSMSQDDLPCQEPVLGCLHCQGPRCFSVSSAGFSVSSAGFSVSSADFSVSSAGARIFCNDMSWCSSFEFGSGYNLVLSQEENN